MNWVFALFGAGVAFLTSAALAEPAERVVSLDYCADQYVVHFVDKPRIASLSPDARKSFSYFRDKAAGLKLIAPRVESILALSPDLVVRSYGGGPKAESYFKQAGIQVLQIPNATHLSEIPNITRQIGRFLGNSEKAEAEARRIEAVLARPAAKLGKSLLYITPGGLTAGRGTMIDELIRQAGYDNFETGYGWRSLPLEKLVRETPDKTVYVSFGAGYESKNNWSAAQHSVVQSLHVNIMNTMNDVNSESWTVLSGAMTSCGAWFVLDALEQLAPPADHKGDG